MNIIRPSGSAKVLFGSMNDAKAAMKKNKENMNKKNKAKNKKKKQTTKNT